MLPLCHLLPHQKKEKSEKYMGAICLSQCSCDADVKDHEQKVQKGLQKPKGKETYLDADPFPHVTSRKLSEQTKRWLSQWCMLTDCDVQLTESSTSRNGWFVWGPFKFVFSVLEPLLIFHLYTLKGFTVSPKPELRSIQSWALTSEACVALKEDPPGWLFCLFWWPSENQLEALSLLLEFWKVSICKCMSDESKKCNRRIPVVFITFLSCRCININTWDVMISFLCSSLG